MTRAVRILKQLGMALNQAKTDPTDQSSARLTFDGLKIVADMSHAFPACGRVRSNAAEAVTSAGQIKQ